MIILAWIIAALTVIQTILMAKKVWWMPIYGLVFKIGLIVLMLATREVYPFLMGITAQTVILALAIPKWYRERSC